MLDRDWNGSFFGECCNCPTVTSALKQPKRIDRMLFIAPQPLQQRDSNSILACHSPPPSFHPCMHLPPKFPRRKLAWLGPIARSPRRACSLWKCFSSPRAQIRRPLICPYTQSSSSSSSSSALVAESSSAFLPTSSVILVPQPRRPNTLKWANIASALAVCAVTEEELLQLACATDEATSPLLSSPLPSLNSALLQPPCRFSYSLLLPASCETGESYIVVLSSPPHIAPARSLR